MATTKSYLELKKLERYQLALNNAMSDPRMSDPLNKVGVSAEVLEEGRNLLNIANKAFNDSYAAKKKRTEVYEIYVKKSDALDALFMIDKKKAKIAFISDELAWNKLGLNKTFHKNRLKQFDIIRIFYTVLSGNQDLLEPLARLDLQAEDLRARLELISEIEKAKANYVLKKGISKDATNVKNKAIQTISKWMTQFFSISRNAFKEEPQLLKAFGLSTKK